MRKRIPIAALAALSLLAAFWVLGAPAREARGADETPPSAPAADVIMLRCSIDGSDFRVTAYEGSPAAPVKKSNQCPEELSLLLKERFVIRDVIRSDFEKKFVVYTLVR